MRIMSIITRSARRTNKACGEGSACSMHAIGAVRSACAPAAESAGGGTEGEEGKGGSDPRIRGIVRARQRNACNNARNQGGLMRHACNKHAIMHAISVGSCVQYAIMRNACNKGMR